MGREKDHLGLILVTFFTHTELVPIAPLVPFPLGYNTRGRKEGDSSYGADLAGSSSHPAAAPAVLEVGRSRGVGGRCIYPLLID